MLSIVEEHNGCEEHFRDLIQLSL